MVGGWSCRCLGSGKSSGDSVRRRGGFETGQTSTSGGLHSLVTSTCMCNTPSDLRGATDQCNPQNSNRRSSVLPNPPLAPLHPSPPSLHVRHSFEGLRSQCILMVDELTGDLNDSACSLMLGAILCGRIMLPIFQQTFFPVDRRVKKVATKSKKALTPAATPSKKTQ